MVGCSGSDDDGVTCGENTHDDGYGVCQLNEVIAITNPAGLGADAKWMCWGGHHYEQFFSDGTGLYLSGSTDGVATGFTWTMGT